MTTTTEPLGADAADTRSALPAQTGRDADPAPGAEDASGAVDDSTQDDRPDVRPAPRRRLIRIMWAVAFVAVIAGLTVAAVGFALSYHTLVDAARGWGFGVRGSYAVPVGIDGLIIALYSIDLVLVWRKMPKPSLLLAAHATTAVTVVLNVTAAADSAPGSRGVWEVAQADPGRLISHAVMPVAYVLLTEAARHLITRTARLEEGRGALTLADWLLDPRGTWRVWRRAQLWGYDYTTVRGLERDRAIYGVWLKYRQEIETARAQHRKQGGTDETFDESSLVTVLDRLPDLLAPYGVTVDEALALPDRMRREEQERRNARERAEQELKHEGEAAARELRHAETLARLAAEKEELREQGELDKLRAQVDGDRKAAEHYAAATADTAGIEAAAQRTRAERLATEEQRRAEAEEQAEETARTAALRLKAAEDDDKAARLEQENSRRRQQLADEKKRAATTAADAQRLAKQAAEDQEAAAAAERRAIEHRTAIARAELVAVAAEDAARLTDRERNIRRVARLILTEAGGNPLGLPLARVEAALGVANGTASGYRTEAGYLIESGYDHRTDPIHAADQGAYR